MLNVSSDSIDNSPVYIMVRMCVLLAQLPLGVYTCAEAAVRGAPTFVVAVTQTQWKNVNMPELGSPPEFQLYV